MKKVQELLAKIGEGNAVKVAIIVLTLMLIFGIGKCICKTVECIETKCLQLTGIREATGHNDGKVIDQVLAECGLAKTGSAYCGATLFHIHLVCGTPRAELPSAPCWAPSWYSDKKIVWRNGDSDVSKIKKGFTVLIRGLSRENVYRIIHVGDVIYLDQDGRGWYAAVFSGNTRDPNNTYNPGEGFHIVKIYLNSIFAIANWLPTGQPVSEGYIVKRGDTLYRIAVMHNTTVAEIRKKNNIGPNNTIWVGQHLRLV